MTHPPTPQMLVLGDEIETHRRQFRRITYIVVGVISAALLFVFANATWSFAPIWSEAVLFGVLFLVILIRENVRGELRGREAAHRLWVESLVYTAVKMREAQNDTSN